MHIHSSLLCVMRAVLVVAVFCMIQPVSASAFSSVSGSSGSGGGSSQAEGEAAANEAVADEWVDIEDGLGDHVDCSTLRQIASPRVCDTITLRDVKLGSAGVGFILTALKSNHVKGLFLHNNALGADGSVHVADALLNSSSIHALQLSHNGVEDHGVEALAVLLRRSKVSSRVWRWGGRGAGSGAAAVDCGS